MKVHCTQSECQKQQQSFNKLYLSVSQEISRICKTLTNSQEGQVNDITKLPAIADLCETLKQLLGMKTKYTNTYNVCFYNKLHC